jgi:solute carrier family 25 citrate transporter 1
MKQGANSAVRFTSYSTLQQSALGYLKPETGKLGGTVTFGLGAIAGLITVCMSIFCLAGTMADY